MEPSQAAVVTTQTPAPPRLRLDYVDGMRAVAALVVVMNHAYAQAWCAFYDQFPAAEFTFLTYSLAVGHLAVSVFIVISGFCLYLPVARTGDALKGGFSRFFKRRARRILPPYYAALGLSLLLIATIIGEPSGSLWDVSATVRTSDVVSHVLLLQNVFGTGRINYVFWSIALEWQIYFLFPLLVFLFRRWSVVGTVLGAMAGGYALTLSGIARVDHANFHYLGLFALGMLTARVAFSASSDAVGLKRRIPANLIAIATLVPATVLILFWGWRTAIERWPLLDLMVGIGAAGLLLSAARTPEGVVTRMFSVRTLVWIGGFSYSLYLVHAPILQILWQYGLKPLGVASGTMFVVLVTVGIPLAVGLSYLFFLLFERPFMNTTPPTRRSPLTRSSPPGERVDIPRRSVAT